MYASNEGPNVSGLWLKNFLLRELLTDTVYLL